MLVPGRNGTFELARGGVYSYYEFTTPPAERLTDAPWRAMLATGKAPAPPGWEAAFRVPCPHARQACSPSYLPGYDGSARRPGRRGDLRPPAA